jgi:crotonobetainyl-CoA:carnitine CoA-transferase CaiB-like acyl-CoA transferase
MFECMVSFLMNEHMQERTFEPAQAPAGYQRLLTPHRKPYATADGYLCVMPYNNRHWQRFFELVGRPELVADERFSQQSARSKNIDALYAIVAESIIRRPASPSRGHVSPDRPSHRGQVAPHQSAGEVQQNTGRFAASCRSIGRQ